MARFVKFGAEVDETTQLQLIRGERARALLGQDQHSPMPLEQEVLSLYAVVNGYFDTISVDKAPEVETSLIAWMTARHPEVMRPLGDGISLSEEAEAALRAALEEFLTAANATTASVMEA